MKYQESSPISLLGDRLDRGRPLVVPAAPVDLRGGARQRAEYGDEVGVGADDARGGRGGQARARRDGRRRAERRPGRHLGGAPAHRRAGSQRRRARGDRRQGEVRVATLVVLGVALRGAARRAVALERLHLADALARRRLPHF